jgi:hypothetical protein
MIILASIILLWSLLLITLYVTQKALLHATWHEPYIDETAILIESDDWGPGASHHAQRLDGLVEVLGQHRDRTGRPAIITADMVLSVPDTQKIRKRDYAEYSRCYLDDGFGEIMSSLRAGISKGIIVPQLHGIEHFYGAGLAKLARQNDPRTRGIFETANWTDWESLDSPLQAHYVDGTQLPTSPVPEHERSEQIIEACNTFRRIFGIPSRSTVAPCYLWDDEVERLWSEQGVQYIQTAGYRCPGRGPVGEYIQDLSQIRPGQNNAQGQTYLVRNAMYEPVDGRDDERCFQEALQARRQGLPVVISTHRYNFTRTTAEYTRALDGLDRLLSRLATLTPALRFLSSPELGDWFTDNSSPLSDPSTGKSWPPLTSQTGITKLRSFLFRLWYRHKKLRIIALGSGLIAPAFLLVLSRKRAVMTAS